MDNYYTTKLTQDNKIEELINCITYQQTTLLQRMQTTAMEHSPVKDYQDIHHGGSTSKTNDFGVEG
jgi:hypothetical protein